MPAKIFVWMNKILVNLISNNFLSLSLSNSHHSEEVRDIKILKDVLMAFLQTNYKFYYFLTPFLVLCYN